MNKKAFSVFVKAFLFIIISVGIRANEIPVTEAATIWLENVGMVNGNHPTQLLDIIARFGHSLPSDLKDQLKDRGFNFSRELVTTDRPLNLDQHIDQGFFRFHYTLTGDDAVDYTDADQSGVPDYIDSILVIFSSINLINFDTLGYNRPPSDDWYTNQENGGSDHYDVYIFELDPGYYGYVQAENYAQQEDIINRGNNENSDFTEINAMVSFMALRNNYVGFPNSEINNLKVTSAHEFFHAIQYGYDGWEFGWVKEATATWMEELIFDEINDCYQYLEDFFDSPELPFNYDTNRGYGSYIYFSYITENWTNNDFIRYFWENSIQFDSFFQDYSIDALIISFNNYGLDFETVTQNFLMANGLTSSEDVYNPFTYEEANNFPMNYPELDDEIHLSGNETSLSISTETGTFAAQYYLITIDSLFSASANGCCIEIDLSSPYNPDTNITAFLTSIEFRPTFSADDITLSNSISIDPLGLDSIILVVSGFNYNYTIISDYGDIEWGDVEFSLNILTPDLLGNDKISKNIPQVISLDQNFPNPFNGSTTIHYNVPFQTKIDIIIFDLNGRLVRLISSESKAPGNYRFRWDGTNNIGNFVGSGPYFYQVNSSHSTIIKKMLYVK